MHDGPHRIGGLHYIFQHLVHDVFLENAKVAVAEQILFQRLEFEAALAGHVTDGEHAEVGQAGFGAHRGEFRIVDENFVARKLVLPGFNGRKGEIEAGLGVFVGVARF